MEKALVKAFFDACRYARHITDMSGTLPDGILSHHIFTIGAVHSLSASKSTTSVSPPKGASIADVAAYLGVSKKTAGDYLRNLYHKGLVQKAESAVDRHTRVMLTEQGKEYHTQYVEKYYDRMMGLFSSINNNDMNITIRTIKQAFYLMCGDAHRQ